MIVTFYPVKIAHSEEGEGDLKIPKIDLQLFATLYIEDFKRVLIIHIVYYISVGPEHKYPVQTTQVPKSLLFRPSNLNFGNSCRIGYILQ